MAPSARTPLLLPCWRSCIARLTGEAEAIALATELPHSLLLLDDADGRETALQLGLDFTGTVGVLLRAKREGKLLALKPVLDRLTPTQRMILALLDIPLPWPEQVE